MTPTAIDLKLPAPDAAELSPELGAQLQLLDAAEQLVLAKMLERLKKVDGRTLDVLPLIHQNLKADYDASLPEDLMAAVAPPLVKDYPGLPLIPLPTEHPPLDMPLSEVLRTRISSHNFSSQPVSLATLGALLHYAYGVKMIGRGYNSKHFPFRMAPSGGSLQPVDLYMVVNDVEGIEQGVYYFNGLQHALVQLDRGAMRHRFSRCCIFQDWIADAHVVLIMALNIPRIHWKYGDRGYRVTHIDTGVLTQNLYMVATALNLVTCAVAAFYDDRVNELLEIDGQNEFATLLFTIGNKPDRIAV